VAFLRQEYDFGVGQAEAHDALRGIEALGLHDAAAVRCALRVVCCSAPEHVGAFERAFDAFFFPRGAGTTQHAYEPRHTRPRDPDAPARERPAAERRARGTPPDESPGDASASPRTPAEPVGLDVSDEAAAWQTLRARFSADPGRTEALALDGLAVRAMFGAADRTIAAVRLGRSRRRRPLPQGPFFDVRRTLRRSLQTGGDPVALQRLGYPRRNPRFVLLIDGSRSMLEHGAPMLAFAAALCRRTRRAHAFVFSTELREVTRELRRSPAPERIEGLGQAWGGGTRIGRSLLAFVRVHGSRLLADDTVAIVFSDGLDVGDPQTLRVAMAQIARRAASVIWLNPHAAAAGFEPAARGMRVALPYVSVLAHADGPLGFERLAARLHGSRRA
jgi:uncharacterized protein with von Willebrand factor type A (vWA) domain